MSSLRPSSRDLLAAYDLSLEQQIVGLGSSLVCRDQDLVQQVEDLLRDGGPEETHCLGLDPLRVMEESLKAEAALTAAGGRVRTRGGLRGLGKAFEVLEQAALNLHLGPWREEYKVVKMYSGLFTHHIKPVLSQPQIDQLFGLLGYQACRSRRDQLLLQPPRISSSCREGLLRLACSFFLARCECLLLLAALGKHGGHVQWELMVVRERQRGLSLQAAVDSTRTCLDVHPQPPFDGDVDMDLYTDQHVNGGAGQQQQRGEGAAAAAVAGDDDKIQHSSPWATQGGVGDSESPSSRDHVCVSTLNYQLTKMAPLDSDKAAEGGEEEEKGAEPAAAAVPQADADGDNFCSCLRSPDLRLRQCLDCSELHHFSCSRLQPCYLQGHHLLSENMEEGAEPAAAAVGAEPAQSDVPESLSTAPRLHRPIGYHDCCDLGDLDPRLLCVSCGVFHQDPCGAAGFCRRNHAVRELGRCSCGAACSRKPLVLCRYCGNEYCNPCWYRNPVVCGCGQTFDQSSSV